MISDDRESDKQSSCYWQTVSELLMLLSVVFVDQRSAADGEGGKS